MIAYQHDGKSEEDLGYNTYVFLDEKKALILDTAYSNHLSQVVEDLKKRKIQITAVLPSHYHPDHFDGLSILEDVEVYGNKDSIKTLKSFHPSEEEFRLFSPSKILKEGEVLHFGKHTFKFRMTPGHSDCSMFITVNNRYLHVGDSYMTLNSGVHSLPYVTWSGVEDHIKTLELLKEEKNRLVLMSHGTFMSRLDQMQSGIEDRIKYLKALLGSNNKATLEEALAGTINTFVNQKWRAYVK